MMLTAVVVILSALFVSPVVSQGCAATTAVTSTGGSIVFPPSGSYDNGITCNWNIYAGDTLNKIDMNIVSVNMESCCDYLSFLINGVEIIRYTGYHTETQSYTFTATQLQLSFHSDGSVVGTGYSLNYIISRPCECTILGANLTGSILFPKSGNYLENANCYWTINATYNINKIYVTVAWLYTESGNDYLSFRYMNGTEITRITGSHPETQSYTFTVPQLQLYFHSDGGTSSTGFFLNYTTPISDCIAALWTSTTLSPTQHYLCSPNNQHKVELDFHGGILIDGQQWTRGDPSSFSPTMNYTEKQQLIITTSNNLIQWRLDLPNNPDNGLAGNVTVTNNGILQIVNASGVPIWNHIQGYLLSRFVSASGPNLRSAPVIIDRDNATCASDIKFATLRMSPIQSNSSMLATVVGRDLSCPAQFNLMISDNSDLLFRLGNLCSFVSNNGTGVCIFKCTCAISVCETVGIVNFGCTKVEICEIVLP